MSIQRWNHVGGEERVWAFASDTGQMVPSDNGTYVTYADLVAAVEFAEEAEGQSWGQAVEELLTRAERAEAALDQATVDHLAQLLTLGTKARAAGLQEAREAVAATFGDHPCTRRTCTDDRCVGARKALAAIDGLQNRTENGTEMEPVGSVIDEIQLIDKARAAVAGLHRVDRSEQYGDEIARDEALAAIDVLRSDHYSDSHQPQIDGTEAHDECERVGGGRMRHYMVDPDNEDRLLKIPPSVVAEIQAEVLAAAREAVAAMRPETDPDIAHVIVSDVLAAIDALRGESNG